MRFWFSVWLFGLLTLPARGLDVYLSPCTLSIENGADTFELIEASLQRIRHGSDGRVAEETNLLYHWIQPVLHGFFVNRQIKDHHTREDLIHETYWALLQSVLFERERNSPARRFLPALFGVARQVMRDHYKELTRFKPRRFAKPRVLVREEPESRYSLLSGVPFPLTDLQLTILYGLASGESHQEIAKKLGSDVHRVHYSIGNIERRIQLLLDDATVRRSELKYLRDLSAQNKIFIQWERGPDKRLFLGEGKLPYEEHERELLHSWAIGLPSDLDAATTQRLSLKLLHERRHAFEELFGEREYLFAEEIDLALSQTEAEFAFLKAFGLDKEEVADLLQVDIRSIAARTDRLKQKVKNVLDAKDKTIDYRYPYYALLQDSFYETRIVFTNSSGKHYLVRASLEGSSRKKQKVDISLSRARVVEEIGKMEGRLGEVMRLRIVDGLSTGEVSNRLGTRIDTVRKHMSNGTHRLSVIFNEPELNLFNLRLH